MIELVEDGTEPTYVSLYEGATLEQAGHIWGSVIKSDGGHCPVCDRWGKLYRRGINANMARHLIWLCLQNPREDGWVDVQRTVFDTEGPDITILDCIGEHFNYSELMNANYYGDYTGSESEDGSEETA